MKTKNKIQVKVYKNSFKVVFSTFLGWPNKGAIIDAEQIKMLIDKGFRVSFEK